MHASQKGDHIHTYVHVLHFFTWGTWKTALLNAIICTPVSEGAEPYMAVCSHKPAHNLPRISLFEEVVEPGSTLNDF